MSRNALTVAQLQLACRHVEEMVEADVSVNFATPGRLIGGDGVGLTLTLAGITLDEDQRLNKYARSPMFDTPEERWREAGIEFPAT